MMKYTFTCTPAEEDAEQYQAPKISYTVFAESLTALLPAFEQFLLGCGFSLEENSHIDIVDCPDEPSA